LRPSILADGGYLWCSLPRGGFRPAKDLIHRLFAPLVTRPELRTAAKDAKTELQEWLQARKLAIPTYAIVETRGQAHQQQFVVDCSVPELGVAEQGEGSSRRAAEQVAAQAVLTKLKASGR
jgi:ribonuclease-3